MTLCRTTFPVRIRDRIHAFFYEKYLVSYSYWDGERARCTVTPLHSHPWNHEVVYFARSGRDAHVVEEEYRVMERAGGEVLLPDGQFRRDLLRADGSLNLDAIALQRVRASTIHLTPGEPLVLDHFESDFRLATADAILHTDGFFRPHRVSVIPDSAGAETRYFAINNYWGALGRVLVYGDDGGISTWSHTSWGDGSRC